MTLTPGQKDQYDRDGYLVFPSLLTRVEIARLLARVEDIVEERIACPAGIRLQEEPAIQRGEVPAPTSRLETLRKVEQLAVFDNQYQELAKDPRLTDVVAGLVGEDIKLFRDALMMKPAQHGSEKPYHQDSAYWQIDPPDLVSAWLALDDATLENGCMRVIPGSHREGILEHKHLRDYQVEDSQIDFGRELAVPLPAGGCLFFHSRLLHATSPNRSDRPRRAMILSYMSARSKFSGPPERQPEFPLIRGKEFEGCV